MRLLKLCLGLVGAIDGRCNLEIYAHSPSLPSVDLLDIVENYIYQGAFFNKTPIGSGLAPVISETSVKSSGISDMSGC